MFRRRKHVGKVESQKSLICKVHEDDKSVKKHFVFDYKTRVDDVC